MGTIGQGVVKAYACKQVERIEIMLHGTHADVVIYVEQDSPSSRRDESDG